jgi:hypothetical protein
MFWWRFYFKYNDIEIIPTAIVVLISSWLSFLAIWSYYTASYTDSGTVEWHHFRTASEMNDKDDQAKWTNDVSYKEMKER